MSDPPLTLSSVSAEGGDAAAIPLFVSAETSDRAGQVLVDFAENERIGIDTPWASNATAVLMTHTPAGGVTFEEIECMITRPDG